MSTIELTTKIRELRSLQALIEEAQAEAEAIKDTIKNHMGDTEELRAGEYKVTWKKSNGMGSLIYNGAALLSLHICFFNCLHILALC